MDTVWERRRLKRETLEPEEMHTAGGGGGAEKAGSGRWGAWHPGTSQTTSSALCQPGHKALPQSMATCLVPAITLFLCPPPLLEPNRQSQPSTHSVPTLCWVLGPKGFALGDHSLGGKEGRDIKYQCEGSLPGGGNALNWG